jgi:hypothetical protein
MFDLVSLASALKTRGGLFHVIYKVVTRWEHIIKDALILHYKPSKTLVLLWREKYP